MQPQPTLWDQMVDTLLAPFRFPGLDPRLALLAIAIGLAFGAIWLAAYRPDAIGRPLALVAVAASSALVTWAAIALVQVPLDHWLDQALVTAWGEPTVSTWLLVAGIPAMLVTGLVQEAAKLAPVVGYRSRNRLAFDARTGLIVGAVAGAGFGVFEATWVHNSMFAADPTGTTLREHGIEALVPFVERFFAVGFHVAVSAIAGYGLARGMGLRLYLVAACLHGALNYGVVLLQAGVLGVTGMELYTAAFAIGSTAIALWLRWRQTPHEAVADTAAAPSIAGLGQPS